MEGRVVSGNWGVKIDELRVGWLFVKDNLKESVWRGVGKGGEEEEEGEFTENNAISGDYNALAKQYIELLGGIENLSKVDNCATRLRLEVRDAGLVNDKGLKSIGARGVVHLNKTNVQVIVGTNVEFIADAMKVLLK